MKLNLLLNIRMVRECSEIPLRRLDSCLTRVGLVSRIALCSTKGSGAIA